MRCLWPVIACAVALSSCGTEAVEGAPDAAVAVDGSTRHDALPRPDAIAVDAQSSDADASCNYDRTRTVPPDGPIGLGTFCDDLYVCVDDREVAEAVALAAPNFTCRPGGPAFDCPALSCRWEAAPQGGGPGAIDQDELDQICALTVLDSIDSDVYCVVHL